MKRLSITAHLRRSPHQMTGGTGTPRTWTLARARALRTRPPRPPGATWPRPKASSHPTEGTMSSSSDHDLIVIGGGKGLLCDRRLHQLVRQRDVVRERTVEIALLEPGAACSSSATMSSDRIAESIALRFSRTLWRLRSDASERHGERLARYRFARKGKAEPHGSRWTSWPAFTRREKPTRLPRAPLSAT